MTKLLPEDFLKLPDSEAKRNAENHAHKLEILLSQMTAKETSDQTINSLHTEANDIWYKMNSQVGRAFYEHGANTRENTRFWLNFSLSVVAILISIYALIKST